MRRISIVLLALVSLVGLAAPRVAAAMPACGLASGMMMSQDQGTVTITCTGIGQELGDTLARVLSRIVENRIDPQAVLVTLESMSGLPADGTPRTLDDTQRQAIIGSLIGKPPREIAIIAHESAADSAPYGKEIATSLLMVGWRIAGNQIARSAPAPLDELRGVALVVHSLAQTPATAHELETALGAARIVAPIVADPDVPAGSVVLWIGKRPLFATMAPTP
jgi:hypothetical protein